MGDTQQRYSRYPRKRPPWAKWYNLKRWKVLRIEVLADEPNCRQCGHPTEVVDHIRAHKGNQALFYLRSNLQALCKRCHDSKTARIDSPFAKDGKRKTIGRCGKDGLPVDKEHPWNQ